VKIKLKRQGAELEDGERATNILVHLQELRLAIAFILRKMMNTIDELLESKVGNSVLQLGQCSGT
jgi:hypothetical protein